MAAVDPASVLLLAIGKSLTIVGVHKFVFVASQSPAACLCLDPVSNREPRLLLVPWQCFAWSQLYKLVSASLALAFFCDFSLLYFSIFFKLFSNLLIQNVYRKKFVIFIIHIYYRHCQGICCTGAQTIPPLLSGKKSSACSCMFNY